MTSPAGLAPFSGPSSDVRILVAEDSVLFREGSLLRLLTDAGHVVVSDVGDADALLAAAREHDVDLVVADVRMPPGMNKTTARSPRSSCDHRSPTADRASVTARRDPARHAPRRNRVVRLPVEGPGAPRRRLPGRRHESRGGWDRSRPGCGPGTGHIEPRRVTRSGDLTPREREVLELAAEGRSNTSIAQAPRHHRAHRRDAHAHDLSKAGHRREPTTHRECSLSSRTSPTTT